MTQKLMTPCVPSFALRSMSSTAERHTYMICQCCDEMNIKGSQCVLVVAAPPRPPNLSPPFARKWIQVRRRQRRPRHHTIPHQAAWGGGGVSQDSPSSAFFTFLASLRGKHHEKVGGRQRQRGGSKATARRRGASALPTHLWFGRSVWLQASASAACTPCLRAICLSFFVQLSLSSTTCGGVFGPRLSGLLYALLPPLLA